MAGFRLGDSSVYMTNMARTDAYRTVRLNASTTRDGHYSVGTKVGGRDVYMSQEHHSGYRSLQDLGYQGKVHNQADTDNPMHGFSAFFRYLGGTYPKD